MQKWRKVSILILLGALVFGVILGIVLAKTGIGKSNLFLNMNAFDWLMLILVFVIIICLVCDVYMISKGKKQFGTFKFQTLIKTRKLLRNLSILLVIMGVLELVFFILNPNPMSFGMFMMMAVLSFMYGMHNMVKCGFSETGISHWGVFYKWDKVKYFRMEDENILKMKVTKKTIGLEYDNEISMIIDEKEKFQTVKFLEEKIGR